METIALQWKVASDQLLAFIRRRVNDRAAAEDIRQDVLLRVYQRLDTLRDAGQFQNWMYQIARNAIIDYYRSRAPMDILPESLSETSSGGAQTRSEMAKWMRPFIALLPKTYRRAVWLAEIDGLTYQKVADRLGISLSAAKSRVRRGKQKMKDLLTECCRFEFDQRGRVVDYERRNSECCEN